MTADRAVALSERRAVSAARPRAPVIETPIVIATVKGADAIITLRCAQARSQWEAICNHRHNQTGAA